MRRDPPADKTADKKAARALLRTTAFGLAMRRGSQDWLFTFSDLYD